MTLPFRQHALHLGGHSALDLAEETCGGADHLLLAGTHQFAEEGADHLLLLRVQLAHLGEDLPHPGKANGGELVKVLDPGLLDYGEDRLHERLALLEGELVQPLVERRIHGAA